MLNNLENPLVKSDIDHKKKLYWFAVIFSLACVFLALFVTDYTNKLLKKDEAQSLNDVTNIPINVSKSFEGRVKYIDPKSYPLDNVSYVLMDNKDNAIILLRADDQKLVVVDGLNVIAFGQITKTSDKKEDILQVEKVVVKR